MERHTLYATISAARRKRLLFGERALYQAICEHSETTLRGLELEGGFVFPADVREALLALGGCSVDDLYMHPSDRIYRFEAGNGRMSGLVTFASDIFGNHFAFDPASDNPDQIYYYSHDPLGWAIVSPDFSSYLQAFVSADFRAPVLTEHLELNEC